MLRTTTAFAQRPLGQLVGGTSGSSDRGHPADASGGQAPHDADMHRTTKATSTRPLGRLRCNAALLLGLALAAGACSSDSASSADPRPAAPPTAPSVTPTDCAPDLPDLEMTCGEIAVPVDHDDPAGDTFTLPYVVLPALGDTPAEEPLVFLQGGPGFSTLSAIPLFIESSELRQDRDVILLEQRGADPSGVFLRCDGGFDSLDDAQECRDRWSAEGVDLSSFTTLDAAKDLALLRTALEIEQWHLLGASYGTTLAMVLMDNDPDGTASVILDGPTAPDVVIYEADAESLLNAFSNVFADCADDADCNHDHPALFETHLANLEGLATEPWDVSASDLAHVFGPSVDHDVYFEVSRLLVSEQPGALPAFVTAIAERDTEALLELASETDDDEGADVDGASIEMGEPEFAIGQNYSIYCAEEAPFFDPAQLRIETIDEWPIDDLAHLLSPVEELCAIWDVAPADPGDVDQVRSAIPTLILAGEYDYTTPLRQGEIAAAGLRESELIEVPSTGHTTIVNECARRIMTDFLRSPGGDRSCLDDIPPIEWR